MALVNLFWLAFVTDVGALESALPLSFLVAGAANGILLATHFTYLPELSEESERPIAVSVFTSVHGLLAGVAPTLWGLALRPGTSERGMNVENFALYFVCGCVVHSVLILLYSRLPDRRSAISVRVPVSR